jgi:lantibiotic modifying enzyme
MAGNAGAIVALLALRGILDSLPLLDCAIRLGDELLQAADKSDVGYSWKSAAFPTQRNLTGFSHGTAGVGYALLELFHATGDPRYRRGAEQAFNYERHWFDTEAANWPDFREEHRQGKLRNRVLSFASQWCHGAPGIALSRLRAYEILKDEVYKSEAMTGLQTTRKMVEWWLGSETGNYSLCHGLTGNAEVLLYGDRMLERGWTEGAALAHVVANAGVENCAKRNHVWPCGTGGGETPGLMLGLAGIGYFYLRLHDPTIPSILLVESENFLGAPQETAWLVDGLDGSRRAPPGRGESKCGGRRNGDV